MVFNRITPVKVVAALFLIGLSLRIFTVVVALNNAKYNPYNQLRGDMASYTALGISLARGEGFSDHYEPVVADFFKDPEHVKPAKNAEPTAKKAVGYPLFLAAIFLIFGYHLTPILFIQAILSAVSTLIVYVIGQQVSSRKTAIIAFAISVFYYPFWYKSIMLLTEPLLIFLTLLFIYGLIRWFTKPSIITGALTGLAAGASFLVKPFILPIIPLYLLWAYFRFRQQKRTREFILSAVALIAGVTLILAPLAIRNYWHSKRLLLTPTFGGYQILLLYNPYGLNFTCYDDPGFVNESYPGFYESMIPSLKIDTPDSMLLILAEYLQDQVYARSAIEFAISNPQHLLRAISKTFWNMWRMDYPRAIFLRKISNLICYVAMIPFFLFGIYTAVRKENVPALLITIFFGYFIVFHSVMASQLRYRITVMPLFFVLSALGLTEAWQKIYKVNNTG